MNAPDGDAAQVVVVVQGRCLKLQRRGLVGLGEGDMVQQELREGGEGAAPPAGGPEVIVAPRQDATPA